MPGYDHLGRKVIISRPCCFDPFVLKPEDVEKANFMIGELMSRDDEQFIITGMVGVIDMTGFNMGHLTQRPMSMIKKQTQFFQVICICKFSCGLMKLIERTEITGRSSTQSKVYAVHQHVSFV